MQSSREFNNIPIPPSTVPTREIKPLPLSGLFETFEELEAAVQDHQRNNGAAVVRDKCSNYRTDDEGNRYPTTRSLRCDRGPRRRSEAAGLRQTSSRKRDCPFIVKATAKKGDDWQWRYSATSTQPRGLELPVGTSDPSPPHTRTTRCRQHVKRLSRLSGRPGRSNSPRSKPCADILPKSRHIQ
jgi:hypothetical protein